jgi:hypothetical protein
MQSIRNHGTGARPQKKRKGEGHLRPAVQRDHSAVSTHPVLIALVRLLAREAAAECLAASGGSSPLPEKVDDQDTQASQT